MLFLNKAHAVHTVGFSINRANFYENRLVPEMFVHIAGCLR